MDAISKIQEALEELDQEPIGQGSAYTDVSYFEMFADKVRRALKAATEQEPVAWYKRSITGDTVFWVGKNDPGETTELGKYRPLFTHPPAAQQDQWKESLIERCIRAGIGFNEKDPESTLTELIKWEVAIATDPTVNGAQQDSDRLVFVLHWGLPTKGFYSGTWSYPEGDRYATAVEAIDAAIHSGKEDA